MAPEPSNSLREEVKKAKMQVQVQVQPSHGQSSVDSLVLGRDVYMEKNATISMKGK